MNTRIILVFLAGILAVGSLSASDTLTLLQEIKEAPAGTPIPDHVISIVPLGDFVYFGLAYQGVIKGFRRDAKTHELTFAGDTVWGAQHDSIDLCRAGDLIYGLGGAGHRTGDQDARGLHWWASDPKTGALTEKGKLDVPIGSGIRASTDGKHLYVLLARSKSVAHYVLGENGAPKLADTAVFEKAAGGLSGFTISPDSKDLYTLWATDIYVVGHAAIGADGALSVKEAVELPQLSEGSTHPRNKWGWGWGRSMFLPPDGSSLYVEFCNYPGKDRHLARCSRNSETGAIAYADRTDASATAAMVRMQVVFEADGTRGFFASSSESSGNVIGWFTRDAKSGALAYGGEVKATKKSGPCCLAYDAERGVLYAGTWSRKNIYVLRVEPTAK